MNEAPIMVSVCMITYNHEAYIAQAIEGVLTQQTTFSIELVIGEDCSTDSTRMICKSFRDKYPEIIRLHLPDSNLGMALNFNITLQSCIGKYTALCEGDDYWTDPYKLQKQVDFLEVHSEVSLCFTNSKVFFENTNKFEDWPIQLSSKYYNFKEIIFDLIIPTCSAVFKNSDTTSFIKRAQNKDYIFLDIILWLSLAQSGNFYCINEQTVVYRKNENSAAYRLNLEKQILLLNQHEAIANDFNGKYKSIEKIILSRQYLIIAMKCFLKFDIRGFLFLKKSAFKNPGQISSNFLYMAKRIFSSNRAI